MKYKIGNRVKDKKTKPVDHDDYEILSTFTSDKYDGYIIINLYTNSISGIESKDFEKETKRSYGSNNGDDTLCDHFKDRYLRVKKQVVNHKDITNPIFNEW